MKNFIFILIMAFVFSGCLSSSLHISSSGNINLHYENSIVTVGKNTIKEKLLFFTDIEIQQYTSISNENNTLFYEDAHTGLDHEFSETELNTFIYAVNEYGNYSIVYDRGNLQLVQVELMNGAYINVLIQADDLRKYLFIYGFSNDELVEIAKAIQLKETKITMPKFKAITFHKDSKTQTRWNTYLINYTPLIKLMNFRRGA